MKNPNFLILDEPTNDLDIDTLNVLEDFLTNYPGVLVLVTHDRYLLDKLTDQLFILEGNGVTKIYNGNYSDYRIELDEMKAEAKRQSKIEAQKPVVKTPEPKKSKLNFKEQKELQDLEIEIAKIEERIKEGAVLLNSGITDHNELGYLAEKIEELNEQLNDKTSRWLQLTELSEA